MTCNRIFLRSVFVAGILFSQYGDVFAWTLTPGTMSTNNQQMINALAATTFSSEPTGTTVTICPEGQYVYKCGNYRVGFNWLKSATFPTQDNNNNNNNNNSVSIDTVTTNNYYINGTTLELFEQMRKFFNQASNDTIEDINSLQVQATEYRQDRELILNSLCHPSTSSISCASCPNSATVEATTVELDGNNQTIERSWNFHTIADCYMEEFTDSTGTYNYVQPSTNNDSAKCYYTNTNPDALSILNGDAIGNFVPGLNIGTINVQPVVIPITATFLQR